MGGSSSSSTQTTKQTDNRKVLGQGSLNAENSTINQTSYSLDNGAIATSFDSQNKTVEGAFDFGSKVLDNSATTVKDALAYGADSQDSAYSFSSGAVSKAFSFAEDANSRALDSLNTTANLVKDSYADAKGRGALTDQILIGAIAMAGLVAYTAVRK